MANQVFSVIFEGEVAGGQNVQEVKGNLAELFKQDPARIDQMFSGKPVIIKKDVDHQTAEKLKSLFSRAGAVCHIKEAIGQESIKTITLQEPGGEFQVYPLKCPFISSSPEGLDMNRGDTKEILYSVISMVSLFSEAGPAGILTNMLFFVNGYTRPFIVDVEKIRFKEFPAVVAGTIPETLKNFIRLLLEKNRNLVLDINTNLFLTGRQNIMRVHKPERYINSLGWSLVHAVAGSGSMVETSVPSTPVQTITKSAADMLHAEQKTNAEIPENVSEMLQTVSEMSQKISELQQKLAAVTGGGAPQSPTKIMPDPAQVQNGLSPVPPMNPVQPETTNEAVSPLTLQPAASQFSPGPLQDNTAVTGSADDLYVKAVELELDREYMEAIAVLEKCIEMKPDYYQAMKLLAEIFTKTAGMTDAALDIADSTPEEEAARQQEHKEKALFYAYKAYEAGEKNNITTAYTLAKSLACNNRAEEGLSFLEQVYASTAQEKQKEKISRRIDDFRKEFNMGRLWQFTDHNDRLIYESTNIDFIIKRLIDGEIPQYARCRCNNIGEWMFIKDLLVKREPKIALLIDPVKYYSVEGGKYGAVVTGSIVALWFVGKFLINYGGEVIDEFPEWFHMGMQNMFAFIAAIVLLGPISLAIAGVLLGISIAVIGGGTGIVGAIPGAIVGGLIGFIVGLVKAPSLPKIGSGSRRREGS